MENNNQRQIEGEEEVNEEDQKEAEQFQISLTKKIPYIIILLDIFVVAGIGLGMMKFFEPE